MIKFSVYKIRYHEIKVRDFFFSKPYKMLKSKFNEHVLSINDSLLIFLCFKLKINLINYFFIYIFKFGIEYDFFFILFHTIYNFRL